MCMVAAPSHRAHEIPINPPPLPKLELKLKLKTHPINTSYRQAMATAPVDPAPALFELANTEIDPSAALHLSVTPPPP